MPVITLLSDFGLKDPYVAEMKAVILSICPETSLVDISHGIEKFDVRMGAFVLASAAPCFPEGTVHIAVVDPGVGTQRRPIIVETERGLYVGPDNGLLLLSARKEGIDHVYEINNPQYMRPEVSRTFHGRDIFAPAAAHLAKVHSPSELGSEIDDYVLPKFAKPRLMEGRLFGEVLYIDGFGNTVTNISAREVEKIGACEGCPLQAELDDKIIDLKLCSAYGEVPPKKAMTIIGSSDFLEISVNQGDASRRFGVKIGDAIKVSVPHLTSNSERTE